MCRSVSTCPTETSPLSPDMNRFLCAGLNSSAADQAFVEALGGVPEGALTGDSVVLLGDLNTQARRATVAWRGAITVSPI